MTALLGDSNNMAIKYYTVVKLQKEFNKDVDDLEMTDKDFLKQLIDNLK